jgi:hypothetical protein
MGSVISHLRGRRTDLPPFVVLPQLMGRGGGNLPNGQAGGFLGKAHDPFALMADPSQKIGRPRQLYTGPTQRDYVPIEQRG